MNKMLSKEERQEAIMNAAKKVAESANYAHSNFGDSGALRRTTITIPDKMMDEISMLTATNKVRRAGPTTLSALVRDLLEHYLAEQKRLNDCVGQGE